MIVWLASYPKSGNTWLRQFLKAYIVGPPFKLNQYHPNFLGDVPINYMQRVSQVPLPDLKVRDQLYLRNAALWNMLKECKGGPLYLKTHHALTAQEGVELIPWGLTSGAIYIVRDPRDVCVSLAYHLGCSIDEAIITMTNKTSLILDNSKPVLAHGCGAWNAHVKGWAERTYPINRVAVRYEDMLKKPRSIFRSILKTVNAGYDKERFDWALDMTKFRSLQKIEQEEGFVEQSGKNNQFFRRGKPGGWKDDLAPRQVRELEKHCAPMMEKFGYERMA